MWDKIKSHPYISGGAIIVAVLIYVYFGGSRSPSTVEYGSDVATADAFQAMQLEVQSRLAAAGIAAAAHSEEIAATVEIENIRAQTAMDAGRMATDVALANVNATSQYYSLRDTLAAEIENTKTRADVEKTAISVTGMTEQTKMISNALTTQAQISANVAQAAIAAQKRDCGLLGKIFGC